MARGGSIIVKLVSESGYSKTTTINGRSQKKLSLKKYDPILRKHVLFKQTKVK